MNDSKIFSKYRKNIKKKDSNSYIPDVGQDSFLIIGIDQAVENTGIGILYCDPSDPECPKPLSCYGDPRNNGDLILNYIQVTDKNRSKDWPQYDSAYISFIEKIDITKKLIYLRLNDLNIFDKIKKVFVVIESVHIQHKNILKILIRQQTIVAIEMRKFFNKETFIYEYTASQAKKSIGGGKHKECVSELINKILNLNIPTYTQVESKLILSSVYNNFSHISDAYALAYAMYRDIISKNIIGNIFQGD